LIIERERRDARRLRGNAASAIREEVQRELICAEDYLMHDDIHTGERQESRHKTQINLEVSLLELSKASVPKGCQPLRYQTITGLTRISLRGYIATTYLRLQRAFGNSEFHRDFPAFWSPIFVDGTIAFVFIRNDLPRIPKHLHLWHVAGNSPAAIERVAEVVRTDYFPLNQDRPEIPF
jgi:hypothetical protein